MRCCDCEYQNDCNAGKDDLVGFDGCILRKTITDLLTAHDREKDKEITEIKSYANRLNAEVREKDKHIAVLERALKTACSNLMYWHSQMGHVGFRENYETYKEEAEKTLRAEGKL